MGGEYMTPDWVAAVRDIGIVLGVTSAFIAAVIAVGKFLIVRPLQEYINERTPKNGGQSLRELHQKFDQLNERIARIEQEITRIDEELEEHVDR
jgi:septal ring factor EnvC (AmiA/AmiB activator)